MEQVRALRGVCIGVDRHMKAGDIGQMDAAQAQFLVGIGAVERVPAAPEPANEPGAAVAVAEPESKPAAPAKPGKKEK